ncbi:unnamed protein product [Nyctereutes procyonoides]|uniref:(raccoon dog) hypothetical protein n=1 Tax=Nyctereutes procyonoides TaxID=34880 RepID=A0A811YJR0_NYCPR|nr:unnamed protein product [Nyctereutes procyonoides]
MLPDGLGRWLAALLRAAVPRVPEGRRSRPPRPGRARHTKASASGTQPVAVSRSAAPRWRRPPPRVGDPRPGARDHAGAKAGARSRGSTLGCSRGEGRGGGGGAARRSRASELYGVGSFLCCRLPLACGAVPCVRGFWKVVGSGHILGRFSRHLTRWGGGGGPGRGASRHHPPRRTHGRTPADREMGSRGCSAGTFPRGLRPSSLAGTKYFQAPGEKKVFSEGWGKGEPRKDGMDEVGSLRITKQKSSGHLLQ